MKDVKDIVFLILHYNIQSETILCVNSIFDKIKNNDFHIVIVDNGSPNQSGKALQQHYEKNDKVSVLLSLENIGFAKGNNLGFKYIKDNFATKFICMMNNDTEIIQDNFYAIIEQSYQKDKFAVLGPKIILNNGVINPINKRELSVKAMRNDIYLLQFLRFINFFYIRDLLVPLKNKKEMNINNKDVNEQSENCILHGCCWIFSPIYIEIFDGIYEGTFLYREEEFLYLRILENHMKMLYNPSLLLRHHEDMATTSVHKTSRSKNEFVYRNNLQSTRLLLKTLKEKERRKKDGE